MKNPYTVLQVLSSATDTEIKEAYVKLVKKYPPERSPERFKEIRKAYETILSSKDRIAFTLFSVEEVTPEHLMEDFFHKEQRNRVAPGELIDIIVKKFEKSNTYK